MVDFNLLAKRCRNMRESSLAWGSSPVFHQTHKQNSVSNIVHVNRILNEVFVSSPIYSCVFSSMCQVWQCVVNLNILPRDIYLYLCCLECLINYIIINKND